MKATRNKLTSTILNSIAHLFADPEFDADQGEVKLLGTDESCIILGLFPYDEFGEVASQPSQKWTIEVSEEVAQ